MVTRQERKTRTGNRMGVVQFSDRTGQFEAVLFSEALAQFRDLLEPGNSVVLMVGAEDRPEGINLRIQSVTSLEQEASRVHRSMRVFIRDLKPVPALSSQLGRSGDGRVSVVVLQERGGEVEVGLPGNYQVTPGVASALRGIDGVVEVELV